MPPRPPEPPGASATRAFTLPELLITIAILSVIIAILLPSLQSLREDSKAARCLNNMSSVGRLLLTYSADNGGTVVQPVILQAPNYTSGKTWNIVLDEMNILPIESYSELKHGIMTCPSRSAAGSHIYNRMHYGINRNPGFDCIGLAGKAPHKILRIQNPSRTMLLGEVKKDYMIQTSSDTLMENIVYPHRQRANVFFYDGHIQAVKGPWLRPTATASYPFY